jgi:hypothetical protein
MRHEDPRVEMALCPVPGRQSTALTWSYHASSPLKTCPPFLAKISISAGIFNFLEIFWSLTIYFLIF